MCREAQKKPAKTVRRTRSRRSGSTAGLLELQRELIGTSLDGFIEDRKLVIVAWPAKEVAFPDELEPCSSDFPNNRVAVPQDVLEPLTDLLERLDALDDVSEVYHNALLPSDG